jgi:hypothetical protein
MSLFFMPRSSGRTAPRAEDGDLGVLCVSQELDLQHKGIRQGPDQRLPKQWLKVYAGLLSRSELSLVDRQFFHRFAHVPCS